MLQFFRWATPTLAVLLPLAARADDCPPSVVVPAPAMSYYAAPAPVVSYYATPAPVVSYYAAPGTVYSAAPVSVSTYRYGIFGRRSLTTVYYGAPAPMVTAPAPPGVAASYYYSPAPVVQPSYYGPVYRLP
jgi:hypothetical protein